jgi:hypothetical protein
MKKHILTIAIVLGLGTAAFAQGGMFQRGATKQQSNGMTKEGEEFNAMLPTAHGQSGSQNADAPLGTGIAVLAALGGAYLLGRKRREE